jgi:hypothetical protein
MNELATAKAIASGALPSPQRIGDSSLVSLRISGTGAAERPALGELVWRDPKIWLTSETIARCSGLSVILDHPASSSLNPAEFAARSVGSVLYPYIADRAGVENIDGPDLWGIARLFLDPDQVAALPDMSTSPSVTFTATDGNQTITLPDGQKCLAESSPSLIDHVAIVTDGAGVWDKRGINSGVRSDSRKGTQSMPDENEGGGNIDPLMTGFMDALDKKLDPLMKRMDALEAQKGAGVLSDAATRRDEEQREWLKRDPEECARDDAEEATEREKMEKAGEPKEVAADKARGARKDRMTKRRNDAARGRSAADAEAERKNRGECADAQARADSAAVAFGERSPPPMSGEKSVAYRQRLLGRFQRHSPDFKNIDLYAINDATLLSGIETRIYADAVKASAVATLPDVLTYTTRAGEGGHQITEARGKHTFIADLKRDSMRVTKFNTPERGAH